VTGWLLLNSVRRAPRRLVLAALAVAFPVALLAATLLFVDASVRSMTKISLDPVQVEMRALATSLNVDMAATNRKLAAVPGVQRVERFAAADVVVGAPGGRGKATARLFAVDRGYIQHHPWVRVVSGSLGQGALLNEPLKAKSGFGSAKTVSIELSGGTRPLATIPVGGVVDLRRAATWFAIPTGEVKGDIALVPRSIVIDYATFQRLVLPGLRTYLGPTTPVLNPGLTDLPPVDVESHIGIDHAAYPSDPGQAATWSAALQRRLERQATGSIVVTDDAAEALTLAKLDAANAKILFLLLGIPGVLAAAALGLAAESALTEAHRREDGLLRLRGATEGQVARIASAHAALAGVIGATLGVIVAGAAVSLVQGRPVWHDVPAGRMAISLGLAVIAGAAVVGVRLFRLLRAGRRSEVVAERRLLERGWRPIWRRARLDLVAIGVGLLILLVNAFTGGLNQTAVEGPSLALSFYVLLGPIALWLGVTLLAISGLLLAFGRWARPDRARPLESWRGAALRWLGRRPARTAVALVLGSLAIAFGVSVVTFVATYRVAKKSDARAAFGSDLRLTPSTELQTPLPSLGPDVAASTAVRTVPVRAGTDRKTILAIDPASYGAATTIKPRIVSGRGVDALSEPSAILVSQEIARDFAVGPGDPLPVTIFPDDEERSRNVNYHVAGVYRSLPPTDPPTEMVGSAAEFPPWLIPVPDFYVARVAPGRDPSTVAEELRRGAAGRAFQVMTIANQTRWTPRSLTSLNLTGLGRIESVGAALIAAIGIAVLGAFLVLERRREFAILRTIGADTRKVLDGPAQEGLIAVLGSLAVGLPVGLGFGMLAVRVLGLFFTLPPPLLVVPLWPMVAFVTLILLTSTLALASALRGVNRIAAATVLREPN
jgi:putative ABC transport system permease protein